MNLDIRTMMVTMSVLSLLFSGLLLLAGLHAASNRGVRYWATASLCISATMALSYFQLSTSNGWIIVMGSTLLALGMCLQWIGVQEFKGKNFNPYIIFAFVLIVFLQSVWFNAYHFEPGNRAIANSTVYAIINFACARELLVPANTPLRTAFRFTAGAFVFLGIALLIRAITIFGTSPESYGLYSNIMINPMTFFLSSIAQLCLTFGFVLMINYQLAAELQTQASKDSLTGAYNRRSLEEEGMRMWARCSRRGEPLAVMMIDIDHFKAINDRYGHLAGDEVLKKLTELALGSIRTEDYFARFGGEEFCILLPSISQAEACLLAERIRANYEKMTINFDGETIKSTISIGVGISNSFDSSFHAVIDRGDQALYQAKQQGRNRIGTSAFLPSLSVA